MLQCMKHKHTDGYRIFEGKADSYADCMNKCANTVSLDMIFVSNRKIQADVVSRLVATPSSIKQEIMTSQRVIVIVFS